MDHSQLIASLPLFKGLPEEQAKLLSQHARVDAYNAGEFIVRESDEVRAFYVVVSGRVKIFKSSAQGREQTLYIINQGEPFCLCTAFEGGISPVNATALELSRILVFPGPLLENLAQREPTLLFNMLLVISRRLRESMQIIENLALKEAPGRVAAFVIHTVQAVGENNAAPLTITQRELAKMLGVTPETLNRALRRMQDEGLLSLDRNMVKALDMPGLERLAQGLN